MGVIEKFLTIYRQTYVCIGRIATCLECGYYFRSQMSKATRHEIKHEFSPI